MKKTALLVALLIIPVILLSKTGVGIIVGEPTGISAKFWTQRNTAIDAALAYSFADKEHFYFHMNYLYHNVSHVDQIGVPWYWGLGANVRFREKSDDQVKIAGRIPLGLNYMFQDFPGEVFIEVSPSLDVVPKIGFSLGAALGFRIYFN
jgi:hypothetical protein